MVITRSAIGRALSPVERREFVIAEGKSLKDHGVLNGRCSTGYPKRISKHGRGGFCHANTVRRLRNARGSLTGTAKGATMKKKLFWTFAFLAVGLVLAWPLFP
jgi:hypothetical protein